MVWEATVEVTNIARYVHDLSGAAAGLPVLLPVQQVVDDEVRRQRQLIRATMPPPPLAASNPDYA